MNEHFYEPHSEMPNPNKGNNIVSGILITILVGILYLFISTAQAQPTCTTSLLLNRPVGAVICCTYGAASGTFSDPVEYMPRG